MRHAWNLGVRSVGEQGSTHLADQSQHSRRKYIPWSLNPTQVDKAHEHVHKTNNLLKNPKYEFKISIPNSRGPNNSAIPHDVKPTSPRAGYESEELMTDRNARYIPGIGRVNSKRPAKEKYVGTLNFTKVDENLKHRSSVYKDNVPSNGRPSAVTERELPQSSWDSLDVLGKDIQLKHLPQGMRCTLFGARIASHRRLFDGEPAVEEPSLIPP